MSGGTYNYGVVFKITTTGAETVLHTFSAIAPDGADPTAGLILDASGNLYGTTLQSASPTSGTVFKLTPAGTETVLHTFAGGANDGAGPRAGLVRDSSGDLYGTTYAGGTNGYGAVFKISTSGVFTVIYSFPGGADGRQPEAGLVLDSQGNLYGTTAEGGNTTSANCIQISGCGVVFKLTP